MSAKPEQDATYIERVMLLVSDPRSLAVLVLPHLHDSPGAFFHTTEAELDYIEHAFRSVYNVVDDIATYRDSIIQP